MRMRRFAIEVLIPIVFAVLVTTCGTYYVGKSVCDYVRPKLQEMGFLERR
jgi:hypothetical protein